MNHLPRVLQIVVLTCAALATNPAPAQFPPPAQAERPDAEAKPVLEEGILQELRLTEVSLARLLEYLRDVDPAFRVVLAFEAGVSRDEPQISELNLKDVTASQVLEALQMAYPQIRVSRTSRQPDNLPPIWTVRVESGHTREAVKVTKVYRLREAVDKVAEETSPKDRAAARTAVLGLLDTAVRVSGDRENSGPPLLKFHEPTEMLVFRGTPDQTSLMDQALSALGAQGVFFMPRPSKASSDRQAERRSAPEAQSGQRANVDEPRSTDDSSPIGQPAPDSPTPAPKSSPGQATSNPTRG